MPRDSAAFDQQRAPSDPSKIHWVTEMHGNPGLLCLGTSSIDKIGSWRCESLADLWSPWWLHTSFTSHTVWGRVPDWPRAIWWSNAKESTPDRLRSLTLHVPRSKTFFLTKWYLKQKDTYHKYNTMIYHESAWKPGKNGKTNTAEYTLFSFGGGCVMHIQPQEAHITPPPAPTPQPPTITMKFTRNHPVTEGTAGNYMCILFTVYI